MTMRPMQFLATMLVVSATLHAGSAASAASTPAPVAQEAPLAAMPPVPAAAPADSAVIEGVVVDAATGTPLPGTLVRIVGLGRQDVTHQHGDFHLLNLPAGRHTLLFERMGYRQEVRTVQLAQRETVTLQVEMRASALTLPGIVVTGTAQARLGEDAVRPVGVLAGQELARRLDVTLASTLEHQPGMAVTSIGPATGRPVIRGLGGDRVLVLEDGARVGDLSSTSGDHAVAVDPLTAQRVEVVRGPAALLYGSNAIGGVINVIREEVPTTLPDRPMGTLSMQGQTFNDGVAAGGTLTAPLAGLAFRAEASGRTAGDMRTPQGRMDNTDLRTWSVGTGLSRVTGTGHAGLAYRYYDNAYGIPGGFVGSHPEGVDIEMRRHSVHGQAHVRRALGPFDVLDVDAKYTNYYHRELEAADIIGTEFGLLTASLEAMARHDELGPLASGAVGARFGWRDFVAGGSTDTPPSVEYSAAAFVLEEVDAGRLRLQGGARVDWHRIIPLDTETVLDIGDVRTRDFASVSASLGGVLRLTRTLSAGASAARAYRTPDTGELFSQGPHLAAYSFEVGNPDLAAEVGFGLDAFMRVSAAWGGGELAVFRNVLNNYIYYRDTGQQSRTGLPIYQATGADAVLHGAEVSGSVEPVRHVVVSGVMSWVRGTLADDDSPLPMMPPLRGQLSARYDRPSFFVGTTWRAVAEQERVAVREFETPTPGFSTFDLDAGYRWVALGRSHALTLRLDNLADALVYDHLSRVRDRDTGRRMPGHGRSASVVYRLVF
jgi:iron complex outermembrane recepter protein